MNSIVDKFDGKKVLIWGYGVEGKSAEKFLNTYCNVSKMEIFEGKLEDLPIEDYDYVIKSPGIPYIYENEPKMTSLTQLFLEEFKDQTIGITGTKGKSTTTSMIYKVLSDCLDRKVCLLGNIGIPCLDAYEDMKAGALAVYEMSCHQLANNTTSPHIAVFLNLYEDHLDYYKTKDKYFKAKTHITVYQNENDILLRGENVPFIDTAAKLIDIAQFDHKKYELKVLGIHNQWNAEVAFLIATGLFDCDKDAVLKSISEFNGLPHRLEHFLTTQDGISFYDDSISTIPEATLNAIESVKDAKTVIVGGMDRGIDYSILTEGIKNYKNIHFILCYESGKRIYESVSLCSNITLTENLKTAVDIAMRITKSGSCILSPAAASYGYFKNFEERGEVFKNYVKSNLH